MVESSKPQFSLRRNFTHTRTRRARVDHAKNKAVAVLSQGPRLSDILARAHESNPTWKRRRLEGGLYPGAAYRQRVPTRHGEYIIHSKLTLLIFISLANLDKGARAGQCSLITARRLRGQAVLSSAIPPLRSTVDLVPPESLIRAIQTHHQRAKLVHHGHGPTPWMGRDAGVLQTQRQHRPRRDAPAKTDQLPVAVSQLIDKPPGGRLGGRRAPPRPPARAPRSPPQSGQARSGRWTE
jgi:hypothetical protein